MTETRETKLTDSEAKMLRVLAERHELMEFNDDDDKEAWPEANIMAFGSELLLAAKARLAKVGQHALYGEGLDAISIEEAILTADLGDLFEVKS